MTDFATARHNMVESQVRPNGITDHRIIAAMTMVRREDFLPEERKAIAYLDEDILIKQAPAGAARYLIEPMAFARMVQLAAITSADRVLVVGAGTGYGASVISHLAGQVLALESDAELAGLMGETLAERANIRIVEGKLEDGYAAGSPYDAIVVEGRVGQVPESWFGQLSTAGRIVAAVGESDVSKVHVLTASFGNHSYRREFDVSISALPGFRPAHPGFVF